MPIKLVLIDNVVEGIKESREKVVAILLFLAFNVLLHSISATNSDEVARDYIPSIAARFGLHGFARKLSELVVVTGCSCAISIAFFYNFSRHREKGFQIFKAVKSLIKAEKVNLNISQLKKLQVRALFLLKLWNRFRYLTYASIEVMYVIPLFANRQASLQHLWLLVVSMLIGFGMATTAITWIMPPVVHLYIVSYYFRLRIKRVKLLSSLIERIPVNSAIKKYVLKLIYSHNLVCKDIALYNQLWKHIYFFTLLTMIPFNLFVLNCLLSGSLKFYMFVGYIAIFLFSAFYVFAIGLCLADIAYQIQQGSLQLNRIHLKCKSRLPLSTWFKIMNCVERISSKHRKIGFTFGEVYYVTYATVFKVRLYSFFQS